jgi:ABC transport system ATP-binding/permease protein
VAQPSKQKLSFKQKHALETLPGRIAKLEEEIAGLSARLSDPKLYAKDADKFAELSKTLAASQASLSALEDEWLELEALRESIEG